MSRALASGVPVGGIPATGAPLPMSRAEMEQRGWDCLDVLLVSGDAHVDHPSFGVALIGRLLESQGYRVGVVAQPDWRGVADFQELGRPRLFAGVSSGNVDSMVANYTANHRGRRTDDYSPGDRAGLRPDRALIVYANRLREAFGVEAGAPRLPIVLGGIEASLRRLAHYDYWDDEVRRSVLLDAKADLLVYGMGESAVLEIASRLAAGKPLEALRGIRGTAYLRSGPPEGCLRLPSFEEVRGDSRQFLEAFRAIYASMSPRDAPVLAQQHGERWVVVEPPAAPLSGVELDRLYELPYTRRAHPRYEAQGGVRALATVRWSLVSHRGCCGECSFCSLYMHQGRIVSSRSQESVLREARSLAAHPDFKGTITDIGGPTLNLYAASCPLWEKHDFCDGRRCLLPEKCPRLRLGYSAGLRLYRAVRRLPGVKHVFLASGFRHDLLLGQEADEYLEEVLRHHVGGQLKLAPEHSDSRVLELMGKPGWSVYERFLQKVQRLGRRLGRRIYLVNYFISAHPGAGLQEALGLARVLGRRRMSPEQVQDFLPLPLTASGAMYHTGVHPFSGERVYSARSLKERRMQRALLQPKAPGSQALARRALEQLAGGVRNRRPEGRAGPGKGGSSRRKGG
jgi:uncharacterized radical SAM protein YgiQ